METLSVIAQIVSFRVFHRRVFRMAPIHHHFELVGWPETTVIVRFWVLGGLFRRAWSRTFLRRLPFGSEDHVMTFHTCVGPWGKLRACVGCRSVVAQARAWRSGRDG